MAKSKKFGLVVMSAIALLGSTIVVLSRFSGGVDGVENGNVRAVFRDSGHVRKFAENSPLRDISAPADETADIKIFKVGTDAGPAKTIRVEARTTRGNLTMAKPILKGRDAPA